MLGDWGVERQYLKRAAKEQFAHQEGRRISHRGCAMYTIYYTEYDTPNKTCVGMVSAPNRSIAHRIAEMQFINSTIHKVMELTPPEEETRFPGARFINGEFRPTQYQDDLI